MKTRGSVEPDASWTVKTRGVVGTDVRGSVKTRAFCGSGRTGGGARQKSKLEAGRPHFYIDRYT